jgi:hypothetical protein
MPAHPGGEAYARPHIQEIASEMTGILKAGAWALPWSIFALCAFLTVASGETGTSAYLFLGITALTGLLMFVFAYSISKLADSVRDAGEHLVVERGGVATRVDIANIEAVGFSSGRSSIVVVRLRRPSRFGDVITFLPAEFWRRCTMVDELRARATQARKDTR